MSLRPALWVALPGLAVAGLVMFLAAASCGTEQSAPPEPYDPLAFARGQGTRLENAEAGVPSMCYTRTAGVSNPCWTCHTRSVLPNELDDWALQEEYAFSEPALTNHWRNLFTDRGAEIAAISDAQAQAWIRQDNYAPLMRALRDRADYPGYRPDLDLARGFDADGFAGDGSGWRAVRYKPFLGTFWPTNGSTDDVFVRLPAQFGRDSAGAESIVILKLNYAVLEAAVCSDPALSDADIAREVEPLDESLAGLDLNGDGQVGGIIDTIRGLPEYYFGQAAQVRVRRNLYPAGIEFLHSVRYVDPDALGLIAPRMKELRYSRKTRNLSPYMRSLVYEREANEKDAGVVPIYAGGPDVGLMSPFGWQFQGFIEDAAGRLRLQTHEEHHFCMGCHTSLGVTVDSTFALTRKVPGAAGWRYQDIKGIPDVPQAGHTEPEILTYFRRVRGGDEFRANTEILARYFPGGVLDEAAVRRAAPGGDRDILELLAPSRQRALQLNKAYMALVRSQRFDLGRDTMISPPSSVFEAIENGDTELGRSGLIFRDGTLFLRWH